MTWLQQRFHVVASHDWTSRDNFWSRAQRQEDSKRSLARWSQEYTHTRTHKRALDRTRTSFLVKRRVEMIACERRNESGLYNSLRVKRPTLSRARARALLDVGGSVRAENHAETYTPLLFPAVNTAQLVVATLSGSLVFRGDKRILFLSRSRGDADSSQCRFAREFPVSVSLFLSRSPTRPPPSSRPRHVRGVYIRLYVHAMYIYLREETIHTPAFHSRKFTYTYPVGYPYHPLFHKEDSCHDQYGGWYLWGR